jgi:hypothetical protein
MGERSAGVRGWEGGGVCGDWLDTLKFARKLTGAGLEPRVAEAIVEELAEADAWRLATREDLAVLEAKILRFMLAQALAVVGLTVTLIRLLPG